MTKTGVRPAAFGSLLPRSRALSTLEDEGHMTIPPPTHDPGQARSLLPASARIDLGSPTSIDDGHLFEEPSMVYRTSTTVQLKGGAVMVRVGTTIFGARSV